MREITCAAVKVLPEPVTPSSTWSRSCLFTPSTSSAMAVGWSPLGSYSDTSLKATPPSDFSGRGGRCGMNCGRLPDTSGMAGDHRLLGQHLARALGALVRLGQDGVQRRRHVADAARRRPDVAQGGQGRGGGRQERRLRRLGEALRGRALGLRRAAGALYGRRGRLARLAARGARLGGGVADVWGRGACARYMGRTRQDGNSRDGVVQRAADQHNPSNHPCFGARLGGTSGGSATHGWRASSHTAIVGAGKSGSAKVPMATATKPGKPSPVQ